MTSSENTPRHSFDSEQDSQVGSEQSAEWYDKSFAENRHWRQHYTESRYYPLWAVIADRLIRSDARSVLDLGCGPGQFASLLRDRKVPEYLGVDFSAKRIKWALKTCPEFEFAVEDIFESDVVSTRNYDSVVCIEFLEHINEDLYLIERIRSGSRVYGSVPNFPYTSHVRHFDSAREVYDRYAEHLEDLSVDVLYANKSGRAYYILEGVKRE